MSCGTSRQHHTRVFVVLLLALLSITMGASLAAPAAAADLSATQWYIQAGKALIPALSQFRVTIKATRDGRSMFNAVVGWSGGALVSASIQTPEQGKAYTDYALRPSGFMLKLSKGEEQIITDMVKHADIFPLANRILSRDVFTEVLGVLGANAKLQGTKKVAGQATNALQANTNLDTLKNALQIVSDKIKADPAGPELLALMAELASNETPAQKRQSDTITKLFAKLGNDGLPSTPVHIESAGGTVIGADTSQWSSWWKKIADKMEPLYYMPKFSISGVKADKAGITAVSYYLTLTSWLPINLNALEKAMQRTLTAQDREALLKAKKIDIYSVNMRRVGNALLPYTIELKTTYDLGPDWRIIPGQDSQIYTYTFTWDLTKGADTKLVEAPALLDAEDAWSKAHAAINNGDQAMAISQLENLTRLAPSFKEAEELLFDLYRKTGRQQDYMNALLRGLQGNPNDAKALNRVAYELVDKQVDIGKGLEMALKAYELNNVDADVTHTLGWAYFRNGNIDEALNMLRSAINIASFEPTSALMGLYQYHLAAALFAQQEYSRALSAVDDALAADAKLAGAAELRVKIVQAMEAQAK